MFKLIARSLLILMILLVAACGTIALPETPAPATSTPTATVAIRIPPTATVRPVTATPTNTPTVEPTDPPTVAPSPPDPPTIPPTAIPAPTDDPPTKTSSGDPAKGKKLFTTFQPIAGMACTSCHRVDSEEKLVGPGLLNVATRAENNVDNRLTARGIDTSAPDRVQQYLHAAITNPTGYVLPGYPDIMPKNWGQAFSEDQLEDLIAYLSSLKN